MKTLTLFFFFVLATVLTTNAQINKGNWMVGGSGSFSNSKAENSSSTSEGTALSIFGDIGYFPLNKFVVGLTPSIGYTKTKGNSISNTSFGIGAFTRYYFLEPDKRINLFTHLEYGFSNSYSRGNRTHTHNNFILKAGPVIYFNSSVGLELTLNYENSESNFLEGSGSKFRIFRLGLGFQIHLEK